MICPSCGRKGNVPPDRLNTTLHCKKCDALFHLDAGGKVVLGEVPAEKPKAEDKPKEFDPIGAFVMWLIKLPMAVKGAFVLAVLAGIGFLVFQRFQGTITGVPTDLLGRLTYIGNQFVDNHPEKIAALATSDSVNDIDTWYKAARRQLRFEGPQTETDFCTIAPEIDGKVEEKEGTTTNSKLMLSPPMPPNSSRNPPILVLQIPWVYQSGEWRINGKALVGTRSFHLK
jgi:hypothetical protein